jgi:undecaprenyl-diphosphatase
MMARSPLARRLLASLSEVGGAVLPGGSAVILLMFAWLGSEVGEGETHAFDARILLSLRSAGDLAQPIGPHWLQMAMLDLTALGGGSVLTLLTTVAIGFVVAKRKWRQAAFIAAAIGGGAVLSALLKTGYARPRPDLAAHLVEVSSASFPSGHAMNSAVTYLTLSVLLARAAPEPRVKAYLIWVGVALTLIVGLSRVYLGVHWPTDVVAGWAVGAAWAGLCWFVAGLMRGGEPTSSRP